MVIRPKELQDRALQEELEITEGDYNLSEEVNLWCRTPTFR
jgi:hypothetical protein